MTIDISNNNPRVSYAVAQGATQTSFTVNFEFFENADLNVYVDGTKKSLTTHYTVSGGSGSTGTVTMSVTGATGGSTVVITRDTTIERTTDFSAGADINRAALNTQLDTLTAMVADIEDQASRAIQVSDHETAPSLELPSIDSRKGTVMGFNASTGAVEAGPKLADVSTLAAVTADIATLADIEDGTDATDAIQTAASNSSNINTVAGISGNVTTVAGVASNVTSVAGNATNINTVAGSISNVNTTASNISSVNTNATNISAIQGASGNASTATTKASEAATSATNAANSATAAAASAAAAAASADTFDDTYLGSKSSDPSTDNDGDALNAGDLYFNTSSNTLKVYSGSAWQDAAIDSSGFAQTTGDTMTGNLSFGDNNKAIFGAGSDLQIYHDGSNSQILDSGTGDLFVKNDSSIYFMNAAGDEYKAYFQSNGGCALYYDNATKLATTATGISVTGNATFADNGKAIFGAGSDLQIYHDGSNSYVDDTGTGALILRGNSNVTIGKYTGETMGYFEADGAAFLYHNNAIKFQTSAVGSQTDQLFGLSDADTGISLGANGSDIMQFYTGNNERMRLTSDGKLGVGTSSPDLTLDVSHGTTAEYVATFQNTADNLELKVGTTTGGLLNIQGANASNNNAYDFCLNADGGNVGVNVTPQVKMHVKGDTNQNVMIVDATGTSANYIFDVRDDGTSKFRVDSSGNVLVGTTSTGATTASNGAYITPDGQIIGRATGIVSYLNRRGSDGNILSLMKDGTDIGSVGNSGNNFYFQAQSSSGKAQIKTYDGNEGISLDPSGYITFETAGSEQMRLVGDDLQIGTTSNSYSASATSGLITNGSRLTLNSGTDNIYKVFLNDNEASGSTGDIVGFGKNTTTVGSITVTASATQYNTSSDYRLKTDVQPMSGATDRLKQLKPVNFAWIADGTRVDGFIAHEAQTVVPEAVSGVKDDVDADGNAKMQGIDQSKLVPLLVKTIQELEARITALEGA